MKFNRTTKMKTLVWNYLHPHQHNQLREVEMMVMPDIAFNQCLQSAITHKYNLLKYEKLDSILKEFDLITHFELNPPEDNVQSLARWAFTHLKEDNVKWHLFMGQLKDKNVYPNHSIVDNNIVNTFTYGMEAYIVSNIKESYSPAFVFQLMLPDSIYCLPLAITELNELAKHYECYDELELWTSIVYLPDGTQQSLKDAINSIEDK
ncbi:hypothetical protein [Aliivibrio fischeri]|uniref:hypothetical protein n=1 Tax=Aliivibrio fischeri TaxID=668 RepID=UPI0007C4E94C|nr:hypothetical protein [Aliivibrio fischeri]